MSKPRVARPLQVEGQSDLLSFFRPKQIVSVAKSEAKPLHGRAVRSFNHKSADALTNQSKRKRPDAENDNVRETQKKATMHMQCEFDNDNDDVPLSSLVQRAGTKDAGKSSKWPSADSTARLASSFTEAQLINQSDILGRQKGTKPNPRPQHASDPLHDPQQFINLDTALEFLNRQKKKQKWNVTDYTLKDIQDHLSEKDSIRPSGSTKATTTTIMAEGIVTASNSSLEDRNVNKIKQEANDTAIVADIATNKPLNHFPPSIQKSLKLVHQLADRSVWGDRGRTTHHGPRTAQSLQIHRQRPNLTAKHASWVGLGTDTHHNGIPTRRIDCMAWDPMGVLLAVAQTCNITKQSWIDVFDWDSVCAADRRGRSVRARARGRNDTSSKFRLDIPPLLQFRIPEVPTTTTTSAAVTKRRWMKWNPSNTDELAVPSRCGTVVFCLNVSHIDKAQAAAPRNTILQPPRHSYWQFKASTTREATSKTASACLFTKTDQIVLAFGADLYCWRYYPKRDPTSLEPKLKWQHSFSLTKRSLLNRPSITSLASIGTEHLIAGFSHGQFALIQWKRVVAANATSAFSLTSATKWSSPSVIAVWQSYASLGDRQLIPTEHTLDPSIMGIHAIHVQAIHHHRQLATDEKRNETSKKKNLSDVVYEQLCGRFRIQWVTRCGWSLAVTLVGSPSSSGQWRDYNVRRENPRILYQTDLVETKLAVGPSVTTTKKEWSLPCDPVAVDASETFVCWQKVAPVTRILPHPDKRVLDELPSLSRDEDKSNQLILALASSFGNGNMLRSSSTELNWLTSLALPKRMGLPKLVNLDPVNQEWVVIATNKEILYIVSLRS
jgi:ribosomal protein L27